MRTREPKRLTSGSRRLIGMLILLLILPLATATGGCATTAPPTTITTQAGKDAWTADQIVTRLGELQRVVIDLSDAKKVKVKDARTIVTWISGDQHATPPKEGVVQAIQQAPAGWRVVALKGCGEVEAVFNQYPTLAPYADVLGAICGG